MEPQTPAVVGATATFDAKALADALGIAAKVTPWAAPNWAIGADAKARMGPPLVEIAAAGGAARIRSANFDRQIVVGAACEGDPVHVVIPLPQLLAWLGKAQAGIQCAITVQSDGVLVRAARQRLTLKTWPVNRYVAARETVGAELSTSATALAAGLGATIAVPREDATQPALGGVLIHGSGSALGFVAADEHRIHELTGAGADEVRMIIPRESARLVADLFAEGAEPVAIRAGAASATFTRSNVAIVTSLIDAPAVLSDEQFARDLPHALMVNAAALLADLELVATVADPRNREVTLHLGERCRAVAASRGDYGGWGKGEVLLEAAWEGPDMAIVFALRPVRDALNTFGESGIIWRMAGPRDPTVITSREVTDRRALVAPFLPTGPALRAAA
ncbi:hypothetical protein OMP43_21780 [Sphingomonas sp. CBMAI 2297]|uniref:DNA polymerase III subunit beta family protein n=1 Tax=Sphingomonas sp. CBMAI 2297 TaxID=2991720 RepID=UPI0024552E67|nr:hypothetical protein [Sphingomonas sp. CBMAI 2297]MDH4746661.1 hypothetical protein [Sphingomonas sp. CBMAI 2297]